MVVADRIVLMRDGAIDQIGNAIDLYRKPKTLFGAEFVGLANILPAKVISADRGTAKLELAPGLFLQCETTACAPGDVVDVICRPEDVEVRAEPLEGENTFPATLRSAYFLGNISDIVVELFGVTLRGQLSAS